MSLFRNHLMKDSRRNITVDESSIRSYFVGEQSKQLDYFKQTYNVDIVKVFNKAKDIYKQTGSWTPYYKTGMFVLKNNVTQINIASGSNSNTLKAVIYLNGKRYATITSGQSLTISEQNTTSNYVVVYDSTPISLKYYTYQYSCKNSVAAFIGFAVGDTSNIGDPNSIENIFYLDYQFQKINLIPRLGAIKSQATGRLYIPSGKYGTFNTSLSNNQIKEIRLPIIDTTDFFTSAGLPYPSAWYAWGANGSLQK